MKADRKRFFSYVTISLMLAAIVASCGTSRSVFDRSANDLADKLINNARKYLGKPYRYAARGPYAFDCSGFTSYLFGSFGYDLASSSAEQERQFPTVEEINELKKGDLVFFEGRARNGVVGHVGIVTEVRSNGIFKFIHASTSYGVIISSSNEPYYAARYLRGGRVLKEIAALTAGEVQQQERKKRPGILSPFTKTQSNTVRKNRNPAGEDGKKYASVVLTKNEPLINAPQKEARSDKQGGSKSRAFNDAYNYAILREESATLPDPIAMEIV
ncbi:MAG: C40 family peptidase [Proteiniphilum sp.]|nr:C40 family peptidase [Proteiniphilum sp.]MDD2725857.1 C40 family peptidase [Proteiniphilum sp.]MDD3331918.1 C40 family peptidase [Proteiniphilum sp.]MDD3555222.1 C40 family peptidase [Proteiniphilum sp.]MDD3979076.1 C40 family peptidase [Proteiniphilum sp.]